ncbi:MAG: VanW family protein [Verrucomicrobiales bacterium]
MPTRWQSLFFLFKATCFRGRRWLLGILRGNPPTRRPGPVDARAPVGAESRSALYPNRLAAEFALQAGKVQNLRLAARHLHGITIPAGEVFSFWAQVPRPSTRRGFAAGRELREGCVIPSVGGGLCQLSNALYDAALKAGFEIVERHAHSRRLPGSMAEAGRDATVFWNYVDLRFRPADEVQLEVFLTRDELVVRTRALAARTGPASPAPPDDDAARASEKAAARAASEPPAESCETCGVTSCFRNPGATSLPQKALTAWLADAWWPEFGRYLQERRAAQDVLLMPLDSKRWRLGNYRWDATGFARCRQHPWPTLRRALASRRLAAQGAARQRALLRFDEAMAQSFARHIPAEATHLVISQNLLPYLHRGGVLGGRTYDVFMQRLPLRALQDTLDRAAVRWPDSPTLADFRADPALLDLESEALAEARAWITPHAAIANLAGPRAIKLDWELPPQAAVNPDPEGAIFFPAPTLGRKGAWELREFARQHGVRLRVAGPNLEAPGFWDGCEVEQGTGFALDGVRAAVLPAWVENQPRQLLRAAAAGIPVFAAPACGLAGVPGVTEIDSLDEVRMADLIGAGRAG